MDAVRGRRPGGSKSREARVEPPVEGLRAPGRYRCQALIVYAGFVQWLVLSGPHEGEFITTLATDLREIRAATHRTAG